MPQKFKTFMYVMTCILSLNVLKYGVAYAAGLNQPALCIMFLTEEASRARDEMAGGKGPGLVNRAARLHVQPADIAVIDRAAFDFVAAENRLREEARTWQRGELAAKRKPAAAKVQSFSRRRDQLALAAFAAIQTNISPASYKGLNDYLVSDLPSSLGAPIVISH